MKVPFVNYKRHFADHQDEYSQVILQTLKDGDLILRHQLEEFETALAKIVGTKYALGVNSCTDAMFLSLKALNIGPGDKVIIPAHTFIATAAAVHWTGAQPVPVDIGENHNIDLRAAQRAALDPTTQAIIPVHLNGRMCNCQKLSELVRHYGLLIIEDAAQALGASYKGEKAGSWGMTGCFSFYPSKILGAFGDSGAVTTDSEELYEKIKCLRNHGYSHKKTDPHKGYGFSSRMDNVQAAVLTVKLKHLDEWIARRRDIAAMYQAALRSVSDLVLPPPPANLQWVGGSADYLDTYQVYEIEAEGRDGLKVHLELYGIETMLPWGGNALHHLIHFPYTNRENTDKLFKRVLQLPMYPELFDEEVEYVIQTIKSYYA